MIISLTGFMGCGKSSVGRELSKLLCCPFMDLDDVIEERYGRSIPEIFATDGEAEFRRMEKDALELVFNTQETRQSAPLAPSHYPGVGKCQFRTNALSPDTEWQNSGHVHLANTSHDQADTPDPSVPVSAVVALGGGTVMTKECAEMVQEHTVCIYLRASVETLLEHLSGGDAEGRPMLEGASLRSRIEELMHLRASTYEKTAHIIIDTDGKSIEAIASEIVNNLLH